MIPSTILFLTLSATVAFANYSPPIPPYQASSAISCYSTPPAKFTSRQTIAEPMACLSTCGASPKVSAFLQKVEGGYDCLCAAETDIAGLAGGVCDDNGWYVYTPYAVSEDDLASSGSGQAESAEEDIVISNAIVALPPTDDPVAAPAPAAAYAAPATNYGYKRRSRVMGLCDAGLRPCNVPGEEAVYQCIDVKTDVTSCGACSTGEYLMGHGRKTSGKGQDCTALPGVHVADVSCVSGKCVVKSCIDGFKLVGGKCIRA